MSRMIRIKGFIIWGFIIWGLGLSSCERRSQEDNILYDIDLDNLFFEYGNDIEKDCVLIIESLKDKRNDFNQKETELVYLEINKELQSYYNYLNYIDSISVTNHTDFFDANEEINNEGRVFLKKSDDVVNKINNVVESDVLKHRVSLLLGVQDVRSNDGIYFNYLDYYYYGVPIKTFNFLIKMRKRDLLLIENEILEELLNYQ